MSKYSGIKHTCPDIDKVIGTLKDIYKGLDNARGYIKSDDKEEADYVIHSAIKTLEEFTGKYSNPLEELRDSNSTLRSFGEEQYERVQELEEENGRLENKVQELNDRINELHDEIEGIESKMEDIAIDNIGEDA
jgi:chromosome segregation ATPase